MNDMPTPTILDGGMGHELKLRGISDGTFLAGVLANEKDCGIVEAVHKEYLAAGCHVITTNSFVAVPQRMIECGEAVNESGARRRASGLIRASVDRARVAVAEHEKASGHRQGSRRVRIAGCVPPLTECYFADKVAASVEGMICEYRVILSTLLDCHVDILLAETLSTTREALAILRALAEVRKNETSANVRTDISANARQSLRPLWISFTIHDHRRATLRSGEPLEEACRTVIREANALKLPLASIGVNCSTPTAISHAVPLLAKMAGEVNIGVSAYGNCFKTTTSEWMDSLEGGDVKDSECDDGMAERAQSHTEDYDGEGYMLPESYARFACQWAKSGATSVGGCCGSRPRHMEEVAKSLKPH